MAFLINKFNEMYPGERISPQGALIISGLSLMVADHTKKENRQMLTREALETMRDNKAAMVQ